MDELYYNKLSEEFVESLEDMEVYEISLSHLTHLFRTNIEWANWGRVIHQDEYRRLHRTHKERLTLPAKERYEQMKYNFLPYANVPTWDISLPIWELLFPHSAASEVTKRVLKRKQPVFRKIESASIRISVFILRLCLYISRITTVFGNGLYSLLQ